MQTRRVDALLRHDFQSLAGLKQRVEGGAHFDFDAFFQGERRRIALVVGAFAQIDELRRQRHQQQAQFGMNRRAALELSRFMDALVIGQFQFPLDVVLNQLPLLARSGARQALIGLALRQHSLREF